MLHGMKGGALAALVLGRRVVCHREGEPRAMCVWSRGPILGSIAHKLQAFVRAGGSWPRRRRKQTAAHDTSDVRRAGGLGEWEPTAPHLQGLSHRFLCQMRRVACLMHGPLLRSLTVQGDSHRRCNRPFYVVTRAQTHHHSILCLSNARVASPWHSTGAARLTGAAH